MVAILLLLFIFHMLCVTTIPNFSKIEPLGFPFVFCLFDQFCIILGGVVYDHFVCFFLCVTIVLITIVLDFAKASNYKLFVLFIL